MTFRVESNVRQMAKDIRTVTRQERFAHVVALTRTGQDVKRAEEAEIASRFDRPTPYTRRAVQLTTATLDRPVAIVELKDDGANDGSGHIGPTNYLSAQIEGGSRRLKRFENSLQLAGYMPKGWFAVPGRYARLDAYGNLSRGQIIQILSQLRITLVTGFTRNLPYDAGPLSRKKIDRAYKRAGGQFFALPNGRGRLRPGIYQRATAAQTGPQVRPRPVVIFIPSATYRKRYDFHGIAERTAAERYERNLQTARIQYGNRDLHT